jgi:hypothetical protein
MAYKASLKIGSLEPLDVLSCSYAFSRNTDHKGKPVSDTSGGTVSLALESTEKSDILETMLNKQDAPQTVTIDFQQSESTASMKKIELKEAFIIQFSESFSDGAPMVYQITLSAKEMTIGSAKLINDWPKAKS